MTTNVANALLNYLGVYSALLKPRQLFNAGTPPKAKRFNVAKEAFKESNQSMDMYRYSLRAGVGVLKAKSPFSAKHKRTIV